MLTLTLMVHVEIVKGFVLRETKVVVAQPFFIDCTDH